MVKGNVFYDIEGYPTYRINKNGEVFSLTYTDYSILLKQRIDRAGYLTVRMSNEGMTHTNYVHRLIAQTFIPAQGGKNEVNHLNGNKLDIRPENLEWSTHSENILHAYRNNLISTDAISKKVIDTSTGQIFKSIKEAATVLNISYGTCRNYLNGNIKTNKTCLKYAA